MNRRLTFLALTLVVATATGLAWADLNGPAKVIDADTLEIDGERIALHGVEAPSEDWQCTASDASVWDCGNAAKLALSQHIDGASLSCQERGRNEAKQVLSVCTLHGVELNAWLVREGWARSSDLESSVYAEQQQQAMAAGKGLWRGGFMPNEQWWSGKADSVAKTGEDVGCGACTARHRSFAKSREQRKADQSD